MSADGASRDQDDAARLARRFIATFGEYDLVVAPSSSCVGTIRELYPQVLGIADRVEGVHGPRTLIVLVVGAG